AADAQTHAQTHVGSGALAQQVAAPKLADARPCPVRPSPLGREAKAAASESMAASVAVGDTRARTPGGGSFSGVGGDAHVRAPGGGGGGGASAGFLGAGVGAGGGGAGGSYAVMEATAKSGYEAARGALETHYRTRLSQLRAELEDEEVSQKRKMIDATDMMVAEFKRQMEAREAREKEEVALEHKRRAAELDASLAGKLSALREEKDALEAQLRQQIASARRDLSNTSTLAEREVQQMREKALAKAEEEARAWAEGQKLIVRRRLMDEVQEQIIAELAPLRAAKLAAAEKDADNQLGPVLAERRAAVSDLESRVARGRDQLAGVEKTISERKAAAAELEADVGSRSVQLPSVLSELRAKQRELRDTDRKLGELLPQLNATTAQLRSTRERLSHADTSAAAMEAHAGQMGAEVAHRSGALAALRVEIAAHQQQLKDRAAEVASYTERSADAAAALFQRTRQLQDADAALAEVNAKLADASAQLSRARADGITRDVSIAAELRGVAAAEYHDVETRLGSSKASLSLLVEELDAVSSELQAKEERLAAVNHEFRDKLHQSTHLSNDLAGTTAALAEVEASLVEKRIALDRVAAMLINRTREWDYETQRAALSTEEAEALDSERQRMWQAVADMVDAERAELLARRLADMRVEIDSVVASEKAALARALRQHADIAGLEAQLAVAEQATMACARAAGVMALPAPPHAPTSEDGVGGARPHAQGAPVPGRGGSGVGEPAGLPQQQQRRQQRQQQHPVHTLVGSVMVTPSAGGGRGSGGGGGGNDSSGAADVGQLPSHPASPSPPLPVERLYSSIDAMVSRAMANASAATPPAQRSGRGTPQQQQQQAPSPYRGDSPLPSASTLPKARRYLRHQRRYMMQRRAIIADARAQFQVAAATAGPVQQPALAQAKAALDEMVRSLNDEAVQLSEMKLRVRAAELQAGGGEHRAAWVAAGGGGGGGGGRGGLGGDAAGGSASVGVGGDEFEFGLCSGLGEASDDDGDDGWDGGVSSSGGGSSISAAGGGGSGVWDANMVQALQQQHTRWVRGLKKQLGGTLAPGVEG
ncbi:hypothetical protein FOA52_007931, partial [Chlamydomonas sp. UWO 241]